MNILLQAPPDSAGGCAFPGFYLISIGHNNNPIMLFMKLYIFTSLDLAIGIFMVTNRKYLIYSSLICILFTLAGKIHTFLRNSVQNCNENISLKHFGGIIYLKS